MIKTEKHLMSRVVALVLSVMLLIGMMPMGVFAADKTSSTLSTDIGEKAFRLHEATEFTFTTTANDDAGTMVKGSFEFSDPDAIEKLEYLESKNGEWYEFNGDFGPATGFPMIDGTSRFRATFSKEGNFTVTASMKTVADGTVLCSTEAEVVVERLAAELSTDIGDKKFTVNEVTEFTFTTTANDDAGTMVKGSFEFSDPDAIQKLEYLESKNGQWYEFSGDFGPATGFPMIDGTSRFRVTFSKIGTFTVTAAMKTVSDGEVLCSTEEEVVVKGVPAVLETDISDDVFNVGDTKEFTYTTIANDDAGKMVKGSFEFSDPLAVEKLEYYEPQNGEWYELSGDFGPANGFPMKDATSKFRVTFKTPGNYTVEVSMKTVADGEVLCSLESEVTVEHKVTAKVSKSEGGTVELNDSEADSVTVDAGESVKVVVTADKGYQIESVVIGGEEQEDVIGKTEFEKDITVSEDTVIVVKYMKVYTATITFTGEGSVITDPKSDGGSVTVKRDEEIEITATPADNHRVTSVIINKKEQTVSGKNDTGYEATLPPNTDYEVEITFAPNVYEVTVNTPKNGTVKLDGKKETSVMVNHGSDVKVTLEPNNGYTIDTVTVKEGENESVPVEEFDDSNEDVYFTISNVTADTSIEVTYKKVNSVPADYVTITPPSDVLRVDGNLYVIKNGDAVVFKPTDSKHYIRVTYGGVVYGTKRTKSVSVSQSTIVTKIEVYYSYAWHVVNIDDITITVDKKEPTASLSAETTTTKNDYYTSDVTFSVTAEDPGNYSGLAVVKWWVVCNGEPSAEAELYKHDDEKGIKPSHTDTITVDATTYNSDKVTVHLYVQDRAGNEFETKQALKINSTRPTVSFAITSPQEAEALPGYYDDERTLTITVVDREDTFLKENVAAALKFTRNGESVTVALKDIDWTHDGSKHTGTYIFQDDGHYEWDVSAFAYENKAGLTNDGIAAPNDQYMDDFYIDKKSPYDLEIIYDDNPSFEATHLQGMTFGFFKETVKVRIQAKDDTAGLAKITYQYPGIEETTVSDIINDDGVQYIGFTIDPQFRGQIQCWATDRAGRTIGFEDGRIVVVDKKIPGVTVKWAPPAHDAYNGKYFNTGRRATIEIEEDNFFGTEEWDYADFENGNLVITRTVDGGDPETLMPEFTKVENENIYTATVNFDQDADYTFDIQYTDRSGNVYDSYVMDDFVVDTIEPKINVAFDNNEAIHENQFNKARTATITVEEHNFYSDGMNVLVNGDEVELEWNEVEEKADTYVAEYTFTGDDDYTFDVSGEDLAGNAVGKDDVVLDEGTKAPWAFTVDTSGPLGLSIRYEPTFAGKLLQGLMFGFYQAPVKVILEATDEVAGIDYFTYSYTVMENASPVNKGEQNVKVDFEDGTKTASTSFEIPASFRGHVSFKATNNAGVSSCHADPNAVVVDEIAPGVTVLYYNNEALNDRYFKADRTATITIKEANFFEEDIKEGLLVITRKTVLNDGTVKEETLAPTFTKAEVGDIYTATVEFNQDADYTFDIQYTDRSGNVYDSYVMNDFTVDKIKPVITIEKANGAYFTSDRSVKITVKEHNFRASDFVFTAEAYNVFGRAKANEIDLSSKAFQTYLRDQKNWTEVAADTWEATITFDIEGDYTIGATYTDLAGNAVEASFSDTFFVDKTGPENLKISYDPTFVGTLLETITFGFYKASVKVTLEATDDIAGIDHFVYQYLVENGASATNTGKSNVSVVPTREKGTNRWYATFNIPAQFRGNVSFTAYDKATNSTFLADKNVIVVDNVAPGVNVEYDNNQMFYDNYFNASRTATITIKEANFFGNEDWKYADNEDEFLVISVGKTLNDGKYTLTKMKPAFTKNGDEYTATILFEEDADYTFDIKYTDRSGNVYDSYEMDKFTVDKIDPVIDVSYNDAQAKYENGNQFRTNRTATVKITEHNFNLADLTASVTANGEEAASFAEYLNNPENWKHYTTSGKEVEKAEEGDIHKAIVKYTEEAHYTFAVGYTDKAGNVNAGVNYGDSVAPTAFTVDKSAPTDMDIKIGKASVAGSMTTLAYDTFYDSAVTVKLSAKCDISGKQSFQYQKVADESEYNVEGPWMDYNVKTGVVVNPSEKFIIYFRAEDKAGNVNIIRSTGIVVDNQKPIGETKAPDIDILPAKPNENGIHNGNVKVDLKVVDPKYTGAEATENGHYSGLNKITYKIYTTDTDAVEEGTLLELDSITTGAKFDADKLVSSWSGNITIDSKKFNSNHVIVEVKAVDNAGNIRTTRTVSGDIKIDVVAPVIEVTYNNNAADSASFFKANRTATVVITERNFKKEDVVVKITNSDGKAPVLSNWTKVQGTGNLDNTAWTATVSYTTDGDYEFGIQYTDLAGWSCKENDVDYANSVAPTKFTIDKTVPTVAVSYDNNSAMNGNYYKAVRTATVVVTEHNFNAERVIITLDATDDGAQAAKPTVSGWSSNGDKHTATIYYSKDAKYTFDVAVTDKAGNAAADYTPETFFVDTTMPTLQISGVADQSANNGDVAPIVSYSDTNYDANNVTITLSGANRSGVELDGYYTDTHNGRMFVFRNFAKEKSVDDIYTLTASLTDKAGNTTEKTIVFSVNRFGSIYVLSEAAKELNGTYVQEPVDVVITETNADELSNIKITLFKDGEPKVLTKGKDYTIQVTGGKGKWYQYAYTILAKNFEDDGVYSLTIESDDKAGNDAKNDLDTKEAAFTFGVDSTLPIVNIENLESGKTYATDILTVMMNIKDNLKLSKVMVLLDGKEYKVWTAEELDEIVKNGGNFSFDIAGDSTDAHDLAVYAIDAAGNGEIISEATIPANAEKVESFYVTTNRWVRYYTNKPLFFGSIAGAIVLAGLIVFLIVWKKKKNEEK